ncbi:MAG: class I tRNA ligase family protein, partial [Candidatus Nanoarchaeia archaeon]
VIETWPIFTTRPDTIYGVTFMVVSAQHSSLMELVSKEQEPKVKEFLKKINSVSEKAQDLEKQGVFTGSYALHPLTKEKVPIYAGNFVLADYGSGMVMAVPAHDQRDFEFAKKYNIPIKLVIQDEQDSLPSGDKLVRAYTGNGRLVGSDKFTGMYNKDAMDSILEELKKQKKGRKVIQYKLRDWLISRQRYWGTPIPIIYCPDCGIVPVPEKDLPVKLPDKVEFGKGNPLETNEKWIKVKCPNCKKEARRETDTMDTFTNSSWYYLRYTDNKNNKQIFDKQKADYWCPVDFYIGGKEHACMHLIYIRFYTKFLRDLGLLEFDEPAIRLFNQGYIYGEDGKKMSKSIGNVVDPMDTIKQYGADALRLYLVSVARPDSDFLWNDKEMYSVYKFINKIYEKFNKIKSRKSKRVESKLNQSVKEITLLMENLDYNLIVIKLRHLFDLFLEEGADKQSLATYLKMLAPFCPHIAEELWEKIGNNKTGKKFISLESWPVADENKIDEQLEKEEQLASKLVDDINNISRLLKEKGKPANKVYIYCLPQEKEMYKRYESMIGKKTQQQIEVYAVNDAAVKSGEKDPDKKAGKAKPGKPAIYLE